MATEYSAVRKLFQILISLAIQRCRLSGILCRLTISLKCFHELETPSVRISISDTGVGSTLEEFRNFDFGAHLHPWDKWDGLLSITTTSIDEKDIHHYQLNLRETVSSSRVRLKRLPSTSKHVGSFSGSEVYFSTDEENIDEFVTWVAHFVQKMLVLKVQDILVDLSIQHIDSHGSRHEHFLPKTEPPFPAAPPQLSLSNIESMSSGLEDYILKHRGSAEIACSVTREDLKVGMGHANSLTVRNGGQEVFEVTIVIVPVATVPCCLRASSQTTEVLYYQKFSPSSISKLALNTLEGIKWQTYGLKLKEILVDGDGQAVLQWEDLPLAHIEIAIHSFYIKYPSPEDHINVLAKSQKTTERKLLRNAVNAALDDLKTKHTALLLSSHSRKIQKYAPDLSRSIASLIASSNDQEFQGECASLLGLRSKDCGNKVLELAIQGKLMKILSMNDMKKGVRVSPPNLFECESLCLMNTTSLQDDDAGF